MTKLTKIASLKTYDVDIDSVPINEVAKTQRRRKTFMNSGLDESQGLNGSSDLKVGEISPDTTDGDDSKHKFSLFPDSPTDSQSRSIPVSFLLHRKISEFANLNQVLA
jgi:hypothetical protein